MKRGNSQKDYFLTVGQFTNQDIVYHWTIRLFMYNHLLKWHSSESYVTVLLSTQSTNPPPLEQNQGPPHKFRAL